MQIFHKLEDVPADFGPTIVSVGNYDGVHRAHQAVLKDIAERARRCTLKKFTRALTSISDTKQRET